MLIAARKGDNLQPFLLECGIRGCYELCPISYSVGEIYKRCSCGVSSRNVTFVGKMCKPCYLRKRGKTENRVVVKKEVKCRVCGGLEMENHPFIVSDGVKLNRHAACVKPKKIKEKSKNEYVMPVEKKCCKCGQVKKYDDFYLKKGRLSSICKKCQINLVTINRDLNPEKYKDYWKDYAKGIRRRK